MPTLLAVHLLRLVALDTHLTFGKCVGLRVGIHTSARIMTYLESFLVLIIRYLLLNLHAATGKIDFLLLASFSSDLPLLSRCTTINHQLCLEVGPQTCARWRLRAFFGRSLLLVTQGLDQDGLMLLSLRALQLLVLLYHVLSIVVGFR